MGLGSKLKKAAGFVPGVNLVVNTAKDVGSALNDARKDVTKATAGGIADLAKPLGPAAIPLLTVGLTATGVGAPLAAALAAGAVQGSKAVDATGSLNAGAKAGATSAALSGLGSLAGPALSNFLSPQIASGLNNIIDFRTAADLGNLLAPIITSGAVRGTANEITGRGSFGSGFGEGVISGGLNTGLNSLANTFVTPALTGALGNTAGKALSTGLTAGTAGGATNVLTGNGSFGQGFQEGATNSGIQQGINGLLDYFGVQDKDYRQAIGETLGGFINKEFFSPTPQNAIFGPPRTNTTAPTTGTTTGTTAPTAPPTTAPTVNTADMPPTTGASPFNLGSLDIGRIGEAFTPKQDTSYSDFLSPASAGLGAVPITPPAFNRPSYFNV